MNECVEAAPGTEAPRRSRHVHVTNGNGDGMKVPMWLVKIIAAGVLAWMVWVTRGIFTLESMAADLRDIRTALVQPHKGGK